MFIHCNVAGGTSGAPALLTLAGAPSAIFPDFVSSGALLRWGVPTLFALLGDASAASPLPIFAGARSVIVSVERSSGAAFGMGAAALFALSGGAGGNGAALLAFSGGSGSRSLLLAVSGGGAAAFEAGAEFEVASEVGSALITLEVGFASSSWRAVASRAPRCS